MKMIKFNDALPYVAYVIDDALNVKEYTGQYIPEWSVLIGWQCGFEPLFIAVYSYLDIELDDQEAEELATDYLEEIKWFNGDKKACDYIIRQ